MTRPIVLPLAILISLVAAQGGADPIGRSGERLPAAYYERKREDPAAFTFRRALIQQVQRIRQARVALMSTDPNPAEVIARADTIAVRGERSIPVFTLKYKNTGSADPFDTAALQARLFGPGADTMRSFYLENSYGLLPVTGTVRAWQTLPSDDTFYEGPDFKDQAGQMRPCHGLCNGSKVRDLIKTSLDSADQATDFGAFDNDGPDGRPNSGDDDGFVDFVAFVHPEAGGECGGPAGGKNIWSHRYAYSSWTGSEYTTNDRAESGGTIQIDDYVIMPGLNCDGTSMIHIGVFAHEFGHAFGLPDLYDTDPDNGVSQGVGHWCLMASGSWGGDGSSPERPAHMSAWAKSFLGWLQPRVIGQDTANVVLPPVQSGRTAAVKIRISNTQYYLLEYRARTGFDANLPQAGLLVWKINDTVLNAGLANNRVNANALNKGVALIEADNTGGLDRSVANNGNRGNPGDPYPGSRNNQRLDAASLPKSVGNVAVCGVTPPAATTSFGVVVSGNSCP